MARAHFHDKNIVLGKDGHWYFVPEDAYGSPPPILSDSWKYNTSNVVVLIASLRETRLSETLLSMFDNAANRNRIFAGVIQQNSASDEDIVQEVCRKRGNPVSYTTEFEDLLAENKLEGENPFAHRRTDEIFINSNNCFEYDHLRVTRLDVSEAKGPVFARGLQPNLVEADKDEFCMQIDAHTVFKKDWDWLLQQQYGATENEFAVLSTYPTNHKELYKNSNKHWEMPHLCGASIGSSGIVRNQQARAAANLDRPILAPLWAAGLSFSKCHAELEVPNDVNLEHVFTGEEFARGARLWTHGYDFYSITRPIIGVYYGGEKGGRGGWHSKSSSSAKSHARIGTLLKAPKSDQSPEAQANLGTFNIGFRRTLEQYYEFSGVDVIHSNSIGNCIVKYIPWEYSKHPLYTPTFSNKEVAHKQIIEEPFVFSYLYYFYGAMIVLIVIFAVQNYFKRKSKAKLPVWKRHLLRQRKTFKSMA